MPLEEEKILDLLVSQNYISQEDGENAKDYVKTQGGSFLDYLFVEGILSKEMFGEAMGEYYRVPYAYFDKVDIDVDVVKMIPELVAFTRKSIPFGISEEGVKIGMMEPDDMEARQIFEKKFGQRVISYYISEEDFEKAMVFYKTDIQEQFKKVLQILDKPLMKREEKDNLVVEIVDMVLQYGHENKASDVHIEPYAKKVLVRFRIDGVMHDVLSLPKDLLESILTRIKILSKMRTDEHRAAQDGKLRFEVNKNKIDVRVSVLPAVYGENVVLRLLESQTGGLSLADLGLSSENFKKVKEAIKNPHGMILVTGPTGSGKTTTLYSILKILNKREVNIATIEDPVEYDIQGITQIQVNSKTNLTFAKGLRSIVRQDPDIIMVGEIRDEETAGIAVNAALTGHLVLSTLHTNDAATTLPRLIDMNVEPFLVSSTVNVAIAQRLVRKICPNCRKSYKLSEEEVSTLEAHRGFKKAVDKLGTKDISRLRIYKGEGCKVCSQTRYKGRIGIYEVLEMSEEVKNLIMAQSSSDEIKKQAVSEGMTTLIEDGLQKVLNGVTTIEELLRVVEE